MARPPIKGLARSIISCLTGAALALTSPGLGVYQALAGGNGADINAGTPQVRTQIPATNFTISLGALSPRLGQSSLNLNPYASLGLSPFIPMSQQVSQAALAAQGAASLQTFVGAGGMAAIGTVQEFVPPPLAQPPQTARPGSSPGAPQAIHAASQLIVGMTQSRPVQNALSPQASLQETGLRDIFGENAGGGTLAAPKGLTVLGPGSPTPRLSASANDFQSNEAHEPIAGGEPDPLSAPPAAPEPQGLTRVLSQAKEAFLEMDFGSIFGQTEALELRTQKYGWMRYPLVFAQGALLLSAWTIGQPWRFVRALNNRRIIEIQQAELAQWNLGQRKTMVVAHSLTLPQDILAGIKGIKFYDQRILSTILAAADPNVNVIFVTSTKVDDVVVDHLLRSRPDREQIKSRVRFIALNDPGSEPLVEKLLNPRHDAKLAEIRDAMAQTGSPAVLFPFISTPWEWRLAKKLGLGYKVWGPHPSVEKKMSNKSWQRRYFRRAGLPVVDGVEYLYTRRALIRAVNSLWEKYPGLKKYVVKINHAASGIGNATLELPDWIADERLRLKAIEERLPAMEFNEQTWESFLAMIHARGAAVEGFIEDKVSSPSGQSIKLPAPSSALVVPTLWAAAMTVAFVILGLIVAAKIFSLGVTIILAVTVTGAGLAFLAKSKNFPQPWIVSSHEQKLTPNGVYVGATFPANPAYRKIIHDMTYDIDKGLYDVLGRSAVDYLAVPHDKAINVPYLVVPERWQTEPYVLFPTEVNIRLGGTTPPWETTVGLAGAQYDASKGHLIARGQSLEYEVVDHLQRPGLIGISNEELLGYLERPENRDVLFNPETLEGVQLHMIPAVGFKGNLAYLIIAPMDPTLDYSQPGVESAKMAAIRARFMQILDALEAEFRASHGT